MLAMGLVIFLGSFLTNPIASMVKIRERQSVLLLMQNRNEKRENMGNIRAKECV